MNQGGKTNAQMNLRRLNLGRLNPGLMLAVMVMLALLIRIAAALTRDVIQMDETSYASLALNLTAGKGLIDITGRTNTYYSPLLPMLIAGASYIFRDIVLSAYAVVTVFGALMLVPVYLLGREFSGPRAGLLAAALAAVLPVFVDYTSMIYSEGLFTFLLLMSLFCGWRVLKGHGVRWGLAAGLTLGLAYLSNPAAMFYLLALLALMLAVTWLRRAVRRNVAKSAGAFLLIFTVFAVPYILFLHAELGRWTYTGKNVDVNLYDASHNLRLGTLEWEQDLLSLTGDKRDVRVMALPTDTDLLAFVVNNPKTAARIFAEQSYVLYSDLLPKVVPLWLLPLLGLGLFARGWDRRRAAQIGYLALMASPMVLVLTMYAHTRFFIPYLAMATVWMGLGWQKLEEWGGASAGASLGPPWQERLGRAWPWLMGAAIILLALAMSTATVFGGKGSRQYREAGEWLGVNGAADKRIMSRESPSAFYSGAVPVYIPYADYQDTVIYARNQEIDYLVIGRQIILDWRPGLKPLLDDGPKHPEWKLVKTIRPGTSEETLIFEFVSR